MLKPHYSSQESENQLVTFTDMVLDGDQVDFYVISNPIDELYGLMDIVVRLQHFFSGNGNDVVSRRVYASLVQAWFATRYSSAQCFKSTGTSKN